MSLSIEYSITRSKQPECIIPTLKHFSFRPVDLPVVSLEELKNEPFSDTADYHCNLIVSGVGVISFKVLPCQCLHWFWWHQQIEYFISSDSCAWKQGFKINVIIEKKYLGHLRNGFIS